MDHSFSSVRLLHEDVDDASQAIDPAVRGRLRELLEFNSPLRPFRFLAEPLRCGDIFA
jgi:hypothetical protein